MKLQPLSCGHQFGRIDPQMVGRCHQIGLILPQKLEHCAQYRRITQPGPQIIGAQPGQRQQPIRAGLVA
jgi:hypothetical protein